MLRHLTTLASIGVVLAVLAAPVQAEVVVNESIDMNLVAFVPCANGGLVNWWSWLVRCTF
jgi:hypothetical protein